MNTGKCWTAVLIAVFLLPNVAASADSATDAFERGKACLDKQDYDAAIIAFTEAIRLDPSNVLAYCNRGTAYWNKGEYDRMIVDDSEAIRLDPKFAAAY